jgi:hypothetical protein
MYCVIVLHMNIISIVCARCAVANIMSQTWAGVPKEIPDERSHVLHVPTFFTFPRSSRSELSSHTRSHVPTFPRSHVPTFPRSHVPTFPRSQSSSHIGSHVPTQVPMNVPTHVPGVRWRSHTRSHVVFWSNFACFAIWDSQKSHNV